MMGKKVGAGGNFTVRSHGALRHSIEIRHLTHILAETVG
jgi:hypothetical protein